MKKIKRRNIIIISVILAFIAIGAFFSINKSYKVEVEITEKGEIKKLIEEVAEVKSKEDYVVYSKVAGILKDILVTEGDYVNSGDVIARIDQGTLAYDIKSTELMIEKLNAQFKEAIKPADKNQLTIAENNVKSTKNYLDQAKESYDNSLKLYEAGSISENDLENTRISYEVSKANYDNALAQVSIIKKGASSNISDQFNSELDNLSNSLDKMREMMEDYNIRAGADGIVTEKYVSDGDYLMPGSMLVEFMDPSTIYLQSEVLDSDAVNIGDGTKVNIIFEDVIYEGVVEKVYPKAYNKVSDLGIVQKRIKVDIRLISQDTILRLGQEVDVEFVEDIVMDQIRVNKDYVYDSDNKKFVLLLEDGIIVEREVELALEGEDYYEVTSGLMEGDKVITNFGDDLSIGSRASEK